MLSKVEIYNLSFFISFGELAVAHLLTFLVVKAEQTNPNSNLRFKMGVFIFLDLFYDLMMVFFQ